MPISAGFSQFVPTLSVVYLKPSYLLIFLMILQDIVLFRVKVSHLCDCHSTLISVPILNLLGCSLGNLTVLSVSSKSPVMFKFPGLVLDSQIFFLEKFNCFTSFSQVSYFGVHWNDPGFLTILPLENLTVSSVSLKPSTKFKFIELILLIFS